MDEQFYGPVSDVTAGNVLTSATACTRCSISRTRLYPYRLWKTHNRDANACVTSWYSDRFGPMFGVAGSFDIPDRYPYGLRSLAARQRLPSDPRTPRAERPYRSIASGPGGFSKTSASEVRHVRRRARVCSCNRWRSRPPRLRSDACGGKPSETIGVVPIHSIEGFSGWHPALRATCT